MPVSYWVLATVTSATGLPFSFLSVVPLFPFPDTDGPVAYPLIAYNSRPLRQFFPFSIFLSRISLSVRPFLSSLLWFSLSPYGCFHRSHILCGFPIGCIPVTNALGVDSSLLLFFCAVVFAVQSSAAKTIFVDISNAKVSLLTRSTCPCKWCN